MTEKLKRYYVTMTWDDFPEGGSFGTIVKAKDGEQAQQLCRAEMAAAQDPDGENNPEEMVKGSDSWELIDCFDLDEWIDANSNIADLRDALQDCVDDLRNWLQDHEEPGEPFIDTEAALKKADAALSTSAPSVTMSRLEYKAPAVPVVERTSTIEAFAPGGDHVKLEAKLGPEGIELTAPPTISEEPAIFDSFQVTTQINITCQEIADLMVSAVEGGCNYWCDKIRLKGMDHQGPDSALWYAEAKTYENRDFVLFVWYDGGPDPVHVIAPDFQRALNVMANKFPLHWRNLIQDNADAETADVFLQLATFSGEMVYG